MQPANDNTPGTGKRFISICSGIEAASVAFGPQKWEAVAFSEIEPAPCSVLAHHYPNVPNLGDMTKFKEWPHYGKDGSKPIDLVCGGTPCQAFSVAGLREGLNDPRGNLSLTFLAIVDKYRPEWVLFENVPGILSSAAHVAPDPRPPEIDLDSGDGPADGEEIMVEDEYDADESHAFSCFLAGLSELGYGVAYRVVDAQYVRVDGFARAVPQRRRRVFVIGYLGDWRRSAAVLLEPESMSGNPAPSRQAGQKPAPTLSARTQGGGGLGADFELDGGLVGRPLLAKGNSGHDDSKETYVPVAFGIAADALDRTGEGAGGTAGERSGLGVVEGLSPTLKAKAPNAVAFGGGNTAGSIDVAACLTTKNQRIDFDAETFIVANDVTDTLVSNGDAHSGFPEAAGLVAHSLTANGFDASEDGTGRGTPIVPVKTGFQGDSLVTPNMVWPCLSAQGGNNGGGAGAILVAPISPNAEPDDSTPYTLAVRGRGDTHNLEWRQDGTANAILTPNSGRSGIGVGAIAAPVGFSNRGIEDDGATETLRAQSHGALPMVAHAIQAGALRENPTSGPDGVGVQEGVAYTLEARAEVQAVQQEWAVRRLTPVECARLQGFPDDYLTQVIHNGKPLADGPMYKGLGNSWPVNSVRWIGRRIQMVEEIAKELAASPVAANDNHQAQSLPSKRSVSHA